MATSVEPQDRYRFVVAGDWGGQFIIEGYPRGPVADAPMLDLAILSRRGPSAAVAISRSQAREIAAALLEAAGEEGT